MKRQLNLNQHLEWLGITEHVSYLYLNQVPESLEALKRSIEIDVKNAKKAVKDRDFMNVRVEEGFKRIIEVVILESVRQGYHTIGSIVWTTFLDKADALNALEKLIEKGLILKHQKLQTFSKIDHYDLAARYG